MRYGTLEKFRTGAFSSGRMIEREMLKPTFLSPKRQVLVWFNLIFKVNLFLGIMGIFLASLSVAYITTAIYLPAK